MIRALALLVLLPTFAEAQATYRLAWDASALAARYQLTVTQPNGTQQNVNTGTALQWTVSLPAGTNTVAVRAVSAEGISSLPATLVLQVPIIIGTCTPPLFVTVSPWPVWGQTTVPQYVSTHPISRLKQNRDLVAQLITSILFTDTRGCTYTAPRP